MHDQAPCDINCHSFTTQLDSRGSLYTPGGCTAQRFNHTKQGQSYANVNTGTDISSFRFWYGGNACRPWKHGALADRGGCSEVKS
ncbi:hypothetical protein AURDEDRAFT_165326 [Auricularia subglabra TFB-10046 SS5]|nr:hypothetical protein AURDEDRAFT_165326 [Auricularia subglabra TFB-10046 SS5]